MKKLKPYLKTKTLLYCFGIYILSLGISLLVKSNFGAAPWDLLCVRLFSRTGISVGTWQIINNLIMIVITKLLFQKKWNFVCLIPGVLLGLSIDFNSSLIASLKINSIVLLLLGCAISALGLLIYMHQYLSANAIDNFTFMLYKEVHLNLSLSKLCSDLIPLFITFVLSGSIPWTVFVIYAMVPMFMQLYKMILMRLTLLSAI